MTYLTSCPFERLTIQSCRSKGGVELERAGQRAKKKRQSQKKNMSRLSKKREYKGGKRGGENSLKSIWHSPT